MTEKIRYISANGSLMTNDTELYFKKYLPTQIKIALFCPGYIIYGVLIHIDSRDSHGSIENTLTLKSNSNISILLIKYVSIYIE